MPADAKRGPYAKGLARRAQILAAALDAYASSGPQGPSLRSIAARVRADLLAFDLSTIDGVWALFEHAAETPGLVKLLADMTAASASPEHPAHKFMQERAEVIF